MKNLEQTTIFKIGDEICHWNNFKQGLLLFFIATDSDVENYSGKNGTYYRKINENV